MKEATGEVSMTVIVIVVLALVLGIGTWLFSGENAPARRWIKDTFEANTGVTTNSGANAGGNAVDQAKKNTGSANSGQQTEKTVIPKKYEIE